MTFYYLISWRLFLKVLEKSSSDPACVCGEQHGYGKPTNEQFLLGNAEGSAIVVDVMQHAGFLLLHRNSTTKFIQSYADPCHLLLLVPSRGIYFLSLFVDLQLWSMELLVSSLMAMEICYSLSVDNNCVTRELNLYCWNIYIGEHTFDVKWYKIKKT